MCDCRVSCLPGVYTLHVCVSTVVFCVCFVNVLCLLRDPCGCCVRARGRRQTADIHTMPSFSPVLDSMWVCSSPHMPLIRPRSPLTPTCTNACLLRQAPVAFPCVRVRLKPHELRESRIRACLYDSAGAVIRSFCPSSVECSDTAQTRPAWVSVRLSHSSRALSALGCTHMKAGDPTVQRRSRLSLRSRRRSS